VLEEATDIANERSTTTGEERINSSLWWVIKRGEILELTVVNWK